MKLIPLTQDKFAMVDDDDFEELSRYRWHADRSRTTFYAARNRKVDGRWRRIRMHVMLTGFTRTDHADGDGLNNRRSNLRQVTQAQNTFNTRSKGGGSPYKGVCLSPSKGRWRAYISPGGRQRHLGYFLTEEEAALAYDAGAREHFGPYAAFNFPLPGERSALTGELVPA